MADKKTNSQENKNEKQISVNTQYVKDLSFENPKAPTSLIANKDRPNINIGIDVAAAAVGDDLYEVVLLLNAKASNKDDEVIFLAELSYAGVFTIKGVDEKELEPALLIFCPSILFPFARRVLADVTRDGGFPPLMIDPIDFGILYQQKLAAAKQAQDKDAGKKEKVDQAN